MTCPHCPDGHTPPEGGSQTWGAWVGPERDGDGQPTTIHVARSGGAHVAESDAQWIRERLNPAHENGQTAACGPGTPSVDSSPAGVPTSRQASTEGREEGQ